MAGSALFLFAPKFLDFGVDVARATAKQHGLTTIHGLCTGHPRVARQIQDALGPLAGEIHPLFEHELQWASGKTDQSVLDEIDATYPLGTAGKTIVADRRLGVGFLHDGRTRPDRIGDLAKRQPSETPRAYLGGLYTFLEDFFDRTQPSTVFCYAVAGAPAYAMGVVAEARNIPFAHLMTTRIGGSYTLDRSVAGDLSATLQKLKNEPEVTDVWRKRARDYIAAFRNRPEKPDYQKHNDADLASRRPASYITSRITKGAWVWSKARLSGNARRLEAANRRFYEAQRMWSEMRVDRAPFSNLEAVSSPFVYFPLHVTPESSTMVMSPWHTNQIAVIEALAKALPAGMELVVKEHRPMLGLRPKGYYETLSKMPRTHLLSPDYDGLALVQKARLTAVITGTSAWEAFCLGKPPLVIGMAAFLALEEGAVYESDLSKLPQAIEAVLTCKPISDVSLENYVATLMAESFEMPSSLLWGDYNSHKRSEREHASSNISSMIFHQYNKVFQ